MKDDNEKFNDIEELIQSLPEPDYDKYFTKDTQDLILNNLLQFGYSYDKKKRRIAIIKKISVGFATSAAILLLAILAFPLYKNSPSIFNSTKQVQPSKEHLLENENKEGKDNNAVSQNNSENNSQKNIIYDNTEYGFIFNLPQNWKGYQIVTSSWDGISSDQQNKIIEHGQLLSIRHPDWTKEKPKQDIPIMIFTRIQWSELEKQKFHIGAAPVGPTMLGQNNKYVFALPARYNFAMLDGYQEVENILKSNPLQTKNDASKNKK